MTTIEIMKEELERLAKERQELEERETIQKKIDMEKERISKLKPKNAIQNFMDNIRGNN